MKTNLTNISKWFPVFILLIPFLSYSQDYKWEWVIEPQFDFAMDFSEGFAAVCKEDNISRKWGFINKNGELVIEYQFDNVGNFSDGRASVSRKDYNDKSCAFYKEGFIDKSGNICIDYKYCCSLNSEFSEGLAAVNWGKEFWKSTDGFIDKNDNLTLESNYSSTGNFSEGLAPVKFYENNKYSVPANKLHYINKGGEIKIWTNYYNGHPFSEGIAIVIMTKIDNPAFTYGAINKKGYEIIPVKFPSIDDFNEGFARVASCFGYKNRRYGFIDKSGNIIIDTILDFASDFSNGLAAVKLKDFWGFIDKTGEMVVPTSLQNLERLSEGVAKASNGKKFGYIRLLNEYEQVFRYINLELDKWDNKGKYEKLNDYQKRVNDNTRKNKIKELQKEALSIIGKEFFERKCQIKNFDYDPESEIFKINMEAIPAIFVNVPIDEALLFDKNFINIIYKKISWGLDDEKVLITNTTLYNPANNKSYTYDINTPVTFKKMEVIANFNPIDIDDVVFTGKAEQNTTIESVAFGLSDVDVDLPQSSMVKEKTYCLIIGNEDYTKYQPNLNTESNVDFAINDAKVFAEYCDKTLGIPKDNITLLKDAISSQMKREIIRLSNKTKYSKGDVELIFYYSGHGFPDNNKEGYIMPVDISGVNVTDGIKLSKLYQDLTQHPARKVTVILDACFSGGGRNAGLLATKGIKVKPKENLLQGNLVIFAASSSDQESLFFKEEQHGLFTYYFLKKLKESKGEASYKEMYDYLKIKVPAMASDKYYKEQNPNMNVSYDVESVWKDWKFK